MNRSGFAAIFIAAASLGGCAGEPLPIERRIAAHSLFGCPVKDDGSLVITPLGDFGVSAASIKAKGAGPLEMRQDFAGIELKLAPQWWGIGYADPPADIDVALWPTDDRCDLTNPNIPPNAGGMAVTSFADGTKLLVVGLDPLVAKAHAAFALAIDLSTGKTLPGPGLPEGRAFATATPFGDDVLVAGGVNPLDPTDPTGQRAASKAFVYSAEKHDFENATIDLGSGARVHHGATTLANGETLLVGGTNEGVVALATMVAVNPVSRNTRVFGLGELKFARKDPTVLRLSNDQVLVAGGTDQSDNPVSALEWFAPDGASCPACPEVNTSLPPRPDLAVVALPSGGALAAGAAPTADVIDVWWITPEGTALALEPIVRTRRDLRVRLVSASDGAPWAWTGTTWLQFDPWQTRFLPVTDAPIDGPAEDMPAPIAVDPGLFVWIAGSPSTTSVVRGFRHGVRGRLTRDAAPLLLSDTSHVAPDRPPRSGVVSFSKEGLFLAKPFTLPAPRALIADTLYGDFDLSAKRDTQRALPDVEVGSIAVGAGSCSWPAGAKDTLFAIHRRGTTLNIEVGDARTTCRGPEGRVGIALRAPQFGETLVRELVISR